VTETTIQSIAAIVNDGIRAGKRLEEITSEILDTGARDSRYRAHVVARTETHFAANFGGMTVAKESGIVERKIWVSVGDARTRDAHQFVASVPLEQLFLVNGEELMYPGDPSGSAENVILCRCAMVYDVQEDG